MMKLPYDGHNSRIDLTLPVEDPKDSQNYRPSISHKMMHEEKDSHEEDSQAEASQEEASQAEAEAEASQEEVGIQEEEEYHPGDHQAEVGDRHQSLSR